MQKVHVKLNLFDPFHHINCINGCVYILIHIHVAENNFSKKLSVLA